MFTVQRNRHQILNNLVKMKLNKITLSERIFLAGASGMAGNSIHKKLIREGYGLVKNNGCILTPGRKELDLLNPLEVNNWFIKNKPTVVIIAAAKVGGIFANSSQPADFILENLKIQNNIIEASWHNNVKRLVFLGSSCIYPKFAKQPIKEEYLLDGQLEITNDCYAIAKIAGIKLCQALNIQYSFDAICLMPTNLFGPNDNYDPKNSHVMASLIKKFCEAVDRNDKTVSCWGDGEPLREFMHVDDLASAVVFLLQNWHPKSENSPKDNIGKILYHLNVGTGKDIAIKDLAKLIAELTGFDGKIIWDKTKPNGTPKKLLDVNRINKLGWQNKIELRTGIEMVIKEYRKINNLSEKGQKKSFGYFQNNLQR